MKVFNRFFILLITLVFIFSLSACGKHANSHTQEVSYRPMLVHYSDSVPGLSHSPEVTYWQHDKYVDESVPKTMLQNIDGKNVTGDYAYTDKDFPNNFATRIYYDERNLQFGLDEAGILQFYFWGDSNINTNNKLICKEQECLSIAKTFLKDYTNIDDYTISTIEKADRGLYEFTFTKYLNGYATTDQAIVTVHNSGTLYSFSSFMLGRISNNNATPFEYEVLIEALHKKLDTVYKDIKNNYTSTIYEEPELFYTILDDGTSALYCAIDIKFSSTKNSTTSTLSERLAFIVPL